MKILLLSLALGSSQAMADGAHKKTGRLSVEPNLKKWINSRATFLNEQGHFDTSRFEGLDSLSRDYLSLKKVPELTARETTLNRASEILDNLRKYQSENGGVTHPLHHYILEELGVVKTLTEQVSELKKEKSFNSCLARSQFALKADSKNFFKSSSFDPKAWITDLDSFRSSGFKRRLVRKYLENTPITNQDRAVEALKPLADKYGWVTDLVPSLAMTKNQDNIGVASLLRKNDCEAAKLRLINWLSSEVSPQGRIVKVVEAASETGRCFRKSGVDARVGVLRDFLPLFEKKFGFEGTAKITIEIARAYWAGDKHNEAREVLADVFSRGISAENQEELRAAQLLLAQIYQNEDRREEATRNFEHLVNNYQDQELKMEGLKSLVLLHSEGQDWVKAAEAAQRIIAGQDLLPPEKREVNRSGFALFWAGRAWLAMGEKDLANAAWKRLKSEYYSTYYGAIGHFLLEESFDQIFDVEMPNDIAFDVSKHLLSPFEKPDQARIAAIDVLLRGGLEREADCEIDELPTDKSSDREYARALLYHAAGSWLKSVKLFDELPRVYRHNLPRGSESILFPLRYKETIENFALRLNLDPDFVIGLVRQESLFDRRALSPVGAMGLMQLMESTAQLEVKKINGDYLAEEQDKKAILDLAVDRQRLFEADTNLMVGIHHVYTLLKKYGSPVFTLSAYNAGPGAMLKWKQRFDPSDLLLFVEKIPYKETNNYVKLILRNYFYYKKWYRDSGLSMPHLETVASPLVNNPSKAPGDKQDQGATNF